MSRFLLGIDAGLTVTKAVVFDIDGTQRGVASRRIPPQSPHPHFVERDQDALWLAVATVVREVVATTGIDSAQIAAIGVTAHGDGLYLVDENFRPVAPGVLSLDTRARSIVERWDADGTSAAVLAESGQQPFASTPASLLAWFAENDPDVIDRAAFALPCKDMLKARMTGRASTDRTEASLSFVDYRTQQYDRRILELYGIPQAWRLLAPFDDSTAISGLLTASAAAEFGLPAGIPVAAGAHDVDCSAIGSGAIFPGQFSLIAGTYSINQAIASQPAIDESWCTRSFVTPGLWIHQAVSPSSATNMEWFVREFCATDLEAGGANGDAFGFVEREFADIEASGNDVLFLPFLYGSPLPDDASGTILGLRGWHSRGHLLRAIMQGVVFNHRWHVDLLLGAFPADSIHLTGGATNSTRWCQLFADILNREVRVAVTPEAGAHGVALLAGVAVGVYSDLNDAVLRAVPAQTVYTPNPESVDVLEREYRRYRRAVAAMGPVWSAIGTVS